METLPLEILCTIASTDHRVWRGMLAVRLFAEYTTTLPARIFVLRHFALLSDPVAKFVRFLLGNEVWVTKLEGKEHSFFNLPSWGNGLGKFWHHQGLLHRINAPAYICSSDYFYDDLEDIEGYVPTPENCEYVKHKIQWWKKGALHRLDGPAKLKVSEKIAYTRWKLTWCVDGKKHRGDDLPAVISQKKCIDCESEFDIEENHHEEECIYTETTLDEAEWYLQGVLQKKFLVPLLIEEHEYIIFTDSDED